MICTQLKMQYPDCCDCGVAETLAAKTSHVDRLPHYSSYPLSYPENLQTLTFMILLLSRVFLHLSSICQRPFWP